MATNKDIMRVVHFEINAKDPEKLSKFYKDIFRWDIKKWGGDTAMDYWIVDTGKSEMGIGGGMMKAGSDQWPRIVNTVNVASVEDFQKKIQDAGGKVVKAKMPIKGMGYVAYCTDPEGIVFGIFESDMSAK